MMDLKEIIRWFIPCFHIIPAKKRKMDASMTFLFFILFFNLCAGMAAKVNSEVPSEIVESDSLGFSLDKSVDLSYVNQSVNNSSNTTFDEDRSMAVNSRGRTFGPPFKKLVGALIPLVFQAGMASTWAIVAALVGFKTLLVASVILKLLLVAGAAKLGAIFASKGHHKEHHESWHPEKQIHLHIHNGQGHEHHEEHASYPTWSRGDGQAAASPVVSGVVQGVVPGVIPGVNNINIVYEPYRGGPQTISTPFGNYVKVGPTATS